MNHADFLRYTFLEQDKNKPGKAGEKLTPRYLAFVVTKNKISWLDLEAARPTEEAIANWRKAIASGKEIPSELPKRVILHAGQNDTFVLSQSSGKRDGNE